MLKGRAGEAHQEAVRHLLDDWVNMAQFYSTPRHWLVPEERACEVQHT